MSEPVMLTHAQAHAALDQGLASTLGQTVAWALRYADAWWLFSSAGWIRADSRIAATLDHYAATMTEADAAVARTAAIRRALTIPER
jgi:hypothetical protein